MENIRSQIVHSFVVVAVAYGLLSMLDVDVVPTNTANRIIANPKIHVLQMNILSRPNLIGRFESFPLGKKREGEREREK